MRASRIAASFASVPELVKKLCCRLPGVICAIFSASATMCSVGKSVEVCCSRLTCALTLLEIFGLQWPTETVRMPPKKSRYLLPSTSQRRSEEHTSELQSPDHLVCRLLLEKKNSN